MTTTADVLGGRAAWSCEAADVLAWLRGLPADCVHCCVTSPPYYGLRDYGVSGQLGLEATPAEYVEKMVAVFREVRRVLHPSGTLFLNLGDSYSATGKSGGGKQGEAWKDAGAKTVGPRGGAWSPAPAGYKPKDLLGIPWRVAFALQADGWYLRQDIIWSKPNPMPESIRDRCTKAHEYVFLLSKSPRYHFDAKAVAEKATSVGGGASFGKQGQDTTGTRAQSRTYDRPEYATRNRRSVWPIATRSYKGAHFAVMPEKLVEPCVLAGCPAGGVVMDPFAGSGTVAAVAVGLGRRFVGCDLNANYLPLVAARMAAVTPPAPQTEAAGACEKIVARTRDALDRERPPAPPGA